MTVILLERKQSKSIRMIAMRMPLHLTSSQKSDTQSVSRESP